MEGNCPKDHVVAVMPGDADPFWRWRVVTSPLLDPKRKQGGMAVVLPTWLSVSPLKTSEKSPEETSEDSTVESPVKGPLEIPLKGPLESPLLSPLWIPLLRPLARPLTTPTVIHPTWLNWWRRHCRGNPRWF